MLQNPLQKASHNPQKWVRNPFWQDSLTARNMQNAWCELYH